MIQYKNLNYSAWILAGIFQLAYKFMAGIPKHRKIFADAIRTRRKNAKLTQEELAEKADLSPTFISNVECGKSPPSLDTLVKLANAFGVKLRDLVADI